MEEMNDLAKRLVASQIPDPTGTLTDQEKLDGIIGVADPIVKAALGEKSIHDAGLDVLNAACGTADKALDHALNSAESAVDTVCDGIESGIRNVAGWFGF